MMRKSYAHCAFRRKNGHLELSWLILVILAPLCATCGQSASMAVALRPTVPATPPAGLHCGAIGAAFGARTTSDPGATQAEACFTRAYEHCSRADLTFTLIAVDVGTIHSLRLQPEGAICAVSDVTQGYSANFGGSRGPLRFYACVGLAQHDGGLLVKSCGAEGDVLVPAPK